MADPNMVLYDLFTRNIASDASQESVASQMPGRENGPADAYRHMLLAAELTRRFGEDYARILLEGHEWTHKTGSHKTGSGLAK